MLLLFFAILFSSVVSFQLYLFGLIILITVFCTYLNTLDSSHHITHTHIPPHTSYHPHPYSPLTLLTLTTHIISHHITSHYITSHTHTHTHPTPHRTQALKAALSGVIVQGIPTVSRAVINEEQGPKGNKTYYLLGQTHFPPFFPSFSFSLNVFFTLPSVLPFLPLAFLLVFDCVSDCSRRPFSNSLSLFP